MNDNGLKYNSAAGRALLTGCVLLLLVVLYSCGGKSDGYREQITADEWEQTTDLYADGSVGFEDTQEDEDPYSPADSVSSKEIPANDSARKEDLMPDTSASAEKKMSEEIPKRHIHTVNPGNLAELFNDSNHYQLLHAERLGIEPISDLRSYFHTRRPLVKVTTNEDFFVEKLTHSYPYLVPEAAQLLHDIGRQFREKVKERKGGDYRIKVTSLLRTPVTVKKLRRINRNATDKSTHQYATTFDIAYNNFVANGKDQTNPGDLKMILAEVLLELHREGRCMIKYERKSPCFHITVVR